MPLTWLRRIECGAGSASIVSALTVMIPFLSVQFSAAAVSLRESPDRLVLDNGVASFELDPKKGGDLVSAGTEGGARSLLAHGYFSFREKTSGRWVDDRAFPVESIRRSGNAGMRTVDFVLRSGRLQITKSFSLSEGESALDVRIRVDAENEDDAPEGYAMFVWLGPGRLAWFRPEKKIQGGEVVSTIRRGSLDPATVGNQTIPVEPEPWVAAWDESNVIGLLAIRAPEERLRFRAGEQNGKGFIGLAFRRLVSSGSRASASWSVEGHLSLSPFSGEPEPEIRARLAKSLRVSAGAGDREERSGGHLLSIGSGAGPSELSVWWSAAGERVFPDSHPPERETGGDEIDLAAFRGGSDSFEVTVRPSASMAGVELGFSPLLSKKGRIEPASFESRPVSFSLVREPSGPAGFTGEVPDELLETASADCAAHRNQSFWVTIRVPEEAAAGIYRGRIRVVTPSRTILSAPIRLRVWGFRLPASRSFSAFAPIWKEPPNVVYGTDLALKLWPAFLRDLAAHRLGPLHPESTPSARWNEDGSLESIDFERFDRAVESHFERFRFSRLVLGDFVVGFGHRPRDGRFGRADEILSPLWKKRMESYARALSRHLRERGWNRGVVFDLFDEPKDEQVPMIRETASLLAAVDPEWRFTYWGDVHPALSGAIRIWTVPASGFSASRARELRRNGDDVWVYNPEGYALDSPAMAPRANAWWMWRAGISVFFQWTIDAWVDETKDGARWDPNRAASWIAPGEHGPRDTIRLELTRAGIEDYEMLALLALRAREAGLPGNRPLALEARSLLASVDEIIRVPRDEKISFEIVGGPAAIERVRRRLGEILEKLERTAGPVEDRSGARLPARNSPSP